LKKEELEMNGKTTCSCGAKGVPRIIYSCSGIASNVGQLSNAAACQLNKEGFGTGSCLAGIGGDVEAFITMAKGADERIVIDGCPIQCGKKILEAKNIPIDRYVLITELGITKTSGPEFNESDLTAVINAVKQK
jgi:uncharacterized metal-binding protein